MIQCKDCQFCHIAPDSRRSFTCDPFINIKEPECIAKWQLIRLDMLLATYQSMLKFQQQLAPMQDKIFKYMKREIEEMDETESWKIDDDSDPQPDSDDGETGGPDRPDF